MSSRIYVVSKFGNQAIGQVDAAVGLITNKGVVAETNVGMNEGVVRLTSGTRGTYSSKEYANVLTVESGTLAHLNYPTGSTCYQFGMSNFDNPRRPSGFYVGNGTNSVPAASYR